MALSPTQPSQIGVRTTAAAKRQAATGVVDLKRPKRAAAKRKVEASAEGDDTDAGTSSGKRAGTKRKSAAYVDADFDPKDPEAANDVAVKPPAKRRRLTKAQQVALDVRRADPQTGSKMLNTFPIEILDRIFGDDALNQRDHLALSGTCALVRLGYTEEVWKALITVGKIPQYHNAFTHRLINDPCDSGRCTTISLAEQLSSEQVPVNRIWSHALMRAADESVKPGIDFKRSKRNPTMGVNHTKVVNSVNQKKTPWGSLKYNYRELESLVNYHDFTPLKKVRCNGRSESLFRLATVDAVILNKAGGPWQAREILNNSTGRKRFKRDTPEPEVRSRRRDSWLFDEMYRRSFVDSEDEMMYDSEDEMMYEDPYSYEYDSELDEYYDDSDMEDERCVVC